MVNAAASGCGVQGTLLGSSQHGATCQFQVCTYRVCAGSVPTGRHGCGTAQVVPITAEGLIEHAPHRSAPQGTRSPASGEGVWRAAGFLGSWLQKSDARALARNEGMRGASGPAPWDWGTAKKDRHHGQVLGQRLDTNLWPSHFHFQAQSPTQGHPAPGPEPKAAGLQAWAPPFDF